MWLTATTIQLILLSACTLALVTSRDSRRKFHSLQSASINKPNNVTHVKDQMVEELCLRMHNNTAFMGAEPFARLRLYSASDCRKNCLEAYPKCVGVIFYYVHGENKNKKYICYLFDKNSVNDEVALVAEKPSSPLDMIRSLEIVGNCHEFDPFPPLESHFTNSSDKVPLKKRDVGFYHPVLSSGSWTQWTPCTEQTRNQFRTQPCEYGRIVQRRICPQYLGGAAVAQANGFQPPPGFVIVAAPYPPEPYVHPSAETDEYARIMARHQEQVQNSCCYRQQFLHQQLQSQFPSLSAEQGQQVFYAMPAVPACERPCESFVITPPLQIVEGQAGSGYVSQVVPPQPSVEITWKPVAPAVQPEYPSVVRPTPSVPSKPVLPLPAPVWTAWSEWSTCSMTCDIGSQQRYRQCNTSTQLFCDGNAVEMRRCENIRPCQTWLPWSEWSSCRANCGTGERSRSRYCHLGDGYCEGTDFEVEPCDSGKPCEEQWAHWEEWSACSASCGQGMRRRMRICNGDHCAGESFEEGYCENEACAVWSHWQEWSSCSSSCEPGVKTRQRVCLGNQCEGESIEQEHCLENEQCPSWSEWEPWSQCSASCGHGLQTRRRMCLGAFCPGNGYESVVCNNEPCSYWTSWQEWSHCSVSCGHGVKTRRRLCIGGYCEGGATEEVDCVEQEYCPTWSEWEPWSQCSATCGFGTKSRARTCRGGFCPGDHHEEMICENEPCSAWAPWQDWSHCSVSCGVGVKTRQRICLGSYCEGPSSEETSCVAQEQCPSWTEWQPWSQCSATCGYGSQTRMRTCMGPFCLGNRVEIIACQLSRCSTWSVWGTWSTCSSVCGTGIQTRSRSCTGVNCVGDSEESQHCVGQSTDCAQWTTWGPWSACDAPCGPGRKTRRRDCVSSDGYSSNSCQGDGMEESSCNTRPCCTWTVWNEWSACDRHCGEGRMTRTRMYQRPGGLDSDCDSFGLSHEHMACNLRRCEEPVPERPRPVAPSPQQPGGRVQPGYVQPGQVQPGQVQPGRVQPGYVQPGQVQPGQVQPGYVQPGQVQPGVVHVHSAPGSYQSGIIQTGYRQGYVQPGQQVGIIQVGYQPGTVQADRTVWTGYQSGIVKTDGHQAGMVQVGQYGMQPGVVSTMYQPGQVIIPGRPGYVGTIITPAAARPFPSAGGACQWSEWQDWSEYQPAIVRRSRTCNGDFGCTCYGLAVQEKLCSAVQCGADGAGCIPACKKKK